MGALFGILLPFIPDLIKMAESAIKGDKVGDDRKTAVMDSLRAMADKIVARKQDPGITAVPGDDSLAALVEAEFQRLKRSGELALADVPKTEQVYVVRGRITPLTINW